MNSKIKLFIQSNMDLIDSNDFTALYKKAKTELNAYTPELTKVLLGANIDPLMYMTEVPPCYLYNVKELKDKTIEIPEGITTIGIYAFMNCDAKAIILPDSVSMISTRAFENCTNIREIHLPNNITFIGQEAFANCANLQKVYSDKTIEHWDDELTFTAGAFEGTGIAGITCVDGLATDPSLKGM